MSRQSAHTVFASIFGILKASTFIERANQNQWIYFYFQSCFDIRIGGAQLFTSDIPEENEDEGATRRGRLVVSDISEENEDEGETRRGPK